MSGGYGNLKRLVSQFFIALFAGFEIDHPVFTNAASSTFTLGPNCAKARTVNVPKGLVAAARKRIQDQFATVGFAKHGHGFSLFRDLNSELAGSVILQSINDGGDGVVHICPWVVMTHIELEKRIAELCEEPYHRYDVSSWSTTLGYLLPVKRHTEWHFPDFAAIPATVNDLFEQFMEYGWPFLESHASLEAIYELIIKRNNVGIWPYAYKVPVMLILLDRKDEARHYVEEKLVLWANERYPAADDYRHFAHRLLASLE